MDTLTDLCVRLATLAYDTTTLAENETDEATRRELIDGAHALTDLGTTLALRIEAHS